MRICLIGRSQHLINTAKLLLKNGSSIPLICTYDKTESIYQNDTNDIKTFAKQIAADFIICTRLDDKIAALRNIDCELAISTCWPVKISQSVIESFNYGILNFHAGDLPKYRGKAAPNWAILNGEHHIGLCIHKMDADYDTGPIVYKTKLELTNNTYISDIYNWLDNIVPNAFIKAIENLKSNTQLEVQPKAGQGSLFCYPRRPEDGKINWSDAPNKILRLIRATSKPFPGAFTNFKGETLIIWRAQIVQHDGDYCAVPGQFCYLDDNCPVIAAGKTDKFELLKLTDMELTSTKTNSEIASMIATTRNNRLY